MKATKFLQRTIVTCSPLLVVMLLSGCGLNAADSPDEMIVIEKEAAQTETTDSDQENVQTETTDSGNEAISAEAADAASYEFPESYYQEGDTVSFDCKLEMLGDFDISSFSVPEVEGEYYIDQEKACELFVTPDEISEQYETGQSTFLDASPTGEMYVFNDGSYVTIDAGINYIGPEYSRHVYDSGIDTLDDASQDLFDFASGTECVDKVRDLLQQIAFPVEEYVFRWVSISGEEYQAFEQAALAEELIQTDQVHDDWNEEDNAYHIYGYQMYEGLHVLPWYRTINAGAAYQRDIDAEVIAAYTENGLVYLTTAVPYKLTPSSEPVEFCHFDEIAQAVTDKYNQLITEDIHYTVSKAMLLLRIYHDDTQSYVAQPVWYLEVTDSSSDLDILMFDALSGEEISLM